MFKYLATIRVIHNCFQKMNQTTSMLYRCYSNESSDENSDSDNIVYNKKILIEKYDETKNVLLKKFWKDYESTIKERGLNNTTLQVSEYNQSVFKLLRDNKFILNEENPNRDEDLQKLELEIENLTVKFDKETIFKSSFTLIELLLKDKRCCVRDYLKDHLPDKCLSAIYKLNEYTIECCIIHVLGSLFNHLNDINHIRLSTLIDHLEMHIVTQLVLLDRSFNPNLTYYELKYLKLDDYVIYDLVEDKKVKGKPNATIKIRNYILGKKLVEFMTERGIITILNKGNENVNYKTEGYKDNLLYVECAFDINLLPIKLNLPMISPPVDWYSIKKDNNPNVPTYMSDIKGGYLVGATGEFYNRFKLLTSKNIDRFYLSFRKDPSNMLEILSFLQRQKFLINKSMLKFIKDNRLALENVDLLIDQCLANINTLAAYELLDEMFYRTDLKTNIKGYFRLDELKENLNKRIQRARYEEFIFQLADAYADYPLYLPAFLDFRGRIYRSGVLHFHERDLAKSLIIFSNSEKDINEINNFSENRIDSGIYNLAIATGFKYQKFSNYKESYDWIKNELIPNQSNILEFARNADDPFQFLSKALYLLYFISENEKGTSFYSSDLRYLLNEIPVSQDASASAYQIMSFLLLNEDLGKRTNMIYGSEDKIQDLYSSLKDELVEYLLKTKCSNDYPQCEDFVKTQIDRKFVKRLFMPLIYGKTIMSMTNDIKLYSERKLPYKAYFKIANDCLEFWRMKFPDIVNLMKLLNLVGWFKSQMNKPVLYGHMLFTTHQFYTKSVKTQISIYDRKTKKRHRVTLKLPTPERDIRKSQVSTCVNFIHQRDACIAMLVVDKLNRYHEHASMYTVHDNFITSPYYSNIIDISNQNYQFKIPSLYLEAFKYIEKPSNIVMTFLMNNLIYFESESYNMIYTCHISFNTLYNLVIKKYKGNPSEIREEIKYFHDDVSSIFRKNKKVFDDNLSDNIIITDELSLIAKNKFYDMYQNILGNFLPDLPGKGVNYIFDREDFRYFLKLNRDSFCHTKVDKKTWDIKTNIFLTCFDQYYTNITDTKYESYSEGLKHQIESYNPNYSLHY